MHHAGQRWLKNPRHFYEAFPGTKSGHFTWGEWVDCFSQEVARATAAEASGAPAKTYYEQWLDAAETLVVAKGVTSRPQLLAKRFAIGAVGPAHVIT